MLKHHALIEAAYDLEPLSETVAGLASILGNDNWQMRHVEEVISLDQALTARLLRFSNSAAVASRSPIARVKDAVVRLGTGSVLSIAMASGVQSQMSVAVPEYGLNEGQLWRHSVAAALAAELIPIVLRVRVPFESFTAALLHDIGKLLLARFLEPDLLRFLEKARKAGGASSLMAEIEILGVHHAELGGLIAEHWRLPPRLVKGIAHHHAPLEGRDRVCDVVHVANFVAKRVGTGGEAGEQDLVVEPDSLERLKIDQEGLDRITKATRDRLDEVIARYQ